MTAMSKLLDMLKKNISEVLKRRKVSLHKKMPEVENKIILGVLLWAVGAVAESDGKFIDEESNSIKELLRAYTDISEDDFHVVLAAIRQAAVQKIDFRKFSEEVSKHLSRDTKISIIQGLLQIAGTDKHVHEKELAIIREIAELLDISKREFNRLAA
jgi:uncharacterized tellurite resistance protein B-like protein